jgi:hypothetical protein
MARTRLPKETMLATAAESVLEGTSPDSVGEPEGSSSPPVGVGAPVLKVPLAEPEGSVGAPVELAGAVGTTTGPVGSSDSMTVVGTTTVGTMTLPLSTGTDGVTTE